MSISLQQLPKERGHILYEGPSLINGEPIVVVVTMKSANRKTGNMPQVWILRKDMTPVEAVKSGDDEAICGKCPHRGTTCYVNVGQAPQAVFRTYRNGGYQKVSLDKASILFSKRQVRLGAYGDPAAYPVEISAAIAKEAKGNTGYTHQWRTCDQRLKRYVMASVDSPEEAALAQSRGWRTFRVRSEDDPIEQGEISCPASDEAGKKTTCADCLLCSGDMSDRSRKIPSISIIVHGKGATHFNNVKQGDSQ
jgi:hypothetical protein